MAHQFFSCSLILYPTCFCEHISCCSNSKLRKFSGFFPPATAVIYQPVLESRTIPNDFTKPVTQPFCITAVCPVVMLLPWKIWLISADTVRYLSNFRFIKRRIAPCVVFCKQCRIDALFCHSSCPHGSGKACQGTVSAAFLNLGCNTATFKGCKHYFHPFHEL